MRGVRGAFADAASGICRGHVVRYRITYVSLVPMIVKNLERGLRAKFDELAWKRAILNGMIGFNKMLTRSKPLVKVSRTLLRKCIGHLADNCWRCLQAGLSWNLQPRSFYDLGIPVVNGYG